MVVGIEIRHLEYLIAASKHGSFRKAATALGVWESTLSRRIRDLEDRVGCPLLIRQSSGVRLTQAGSVFTNQVQIAVNQIRHAVIEAKASNTSANDILRIGITFATQSRFLRNFIRLFENKYPSVRVEFVHGGSDSHLSAILDQTVDVAFLPDTTRIEGLNSFILWDEKVYLAMSEFDNLAVNNHLTWADLYNRVFVVSSFSPGPEYYSRIIRKLGTSDYRPLVFHENVHRDVLMHIVVSKGCLKLTNEGTTSIGFPGITYRPIVGEKIIFSAFWANSNENLRLQQLINLARSLRADGPS